MHRVRLRLPRGQIVRYRHLDLLHDAIVSGLIGAGAEPAQVIGTTAQPWTFAALGWHHGHEGQAHGLVIATPSPVLASALAALAPDAVRYARAGTGELCDFAAAAVEPEPPPFLGDPAVLGVLTLSPIAISDPAAAPRKRWFTDLGGCDLSAAVNARLSRLAGRPVALSVQPDSLYLRANPRHSVLVSTKALPNGRRAYVIGMQAPLVISGSRDDVLLAWYAGLGEKTRNGFGCIGLAEAGVGR